MSHTRREFLKTSFGASALVSLGPTVPAFLARSAEAAQQRTDHTGTVLVVLQLAGGNDGLNTVVPYGDDEYARNRRTLRLTADQVHKIDSLLGFHPEMQAFVKLYKEGLLSIVQGVGYPNPNQDHAAAMRNWHTARPEEPNCRTGWLGRAADEAYCADEADVPGVFVGQIPRPFILNAEKAVVPSLRSLEQCTLRPMPGPEGGPAHRRRLLKAAELARPLEGNPLLDLVRRSTLGAHAASRQIEAAASAQTSTRASEYPPFQLARMLSIVAQLIRADVGIRMFCTELGGAEPGGFDTHANQRDNHAALLRQLSESVAAFVEDLQRDKLLDRVLLMTFSEFGRTVAENGRRGTGHGSAAPVFLAGGRLKGGLAGSHPKLTELEQGGLKFHTDFRRVYATVLDRWLQIDPQAVLGEEFEPLDVLQV